MRALGFALAFAALTGCGRSGRPDLVDAGRKTVPVVGALAESGPTPASDSMAPETAGEPLDAAEPTDGSVVLLDPGRPPRRLLRYSWRIGQKEQLAVDLRTTLVRDSDDASAPGLVLPPVHISLQIDPERVSADGDLTYAWHVASASVTAGQETAAYVAEGMRAEVARVNHLAGSATVTAKGMCAQIRIDSRSRDGDAEATSGQMEEQIRQTLRELTPPFPDDAVGPGARWQRSSSLLAKDARVTQTDSFTWVEATPEGGRLDDVLAQRAPAQALRGPGASHARMESMLASGRSEISFMTSRIVPTTHFLGTTTMVLSGTSSDSADGRVKMALRVEILTNGNLR